MTYQQQIEEFRDKYVVLFHSMAVVKTPNNCQWLQMHILDKRICFLLEAYEKEKRDKSLHCAAQMLYNISSAFESDNDFPDIPKFELN